MDNAAKLILLVTSIVTFRLSNGVVRGQPNTGSGRVTLSPLTPSTLLDPSPEAS
jgi:hypothetical protein